MKIFITGATGFIGTHLVRRLAQSDHESHCFVRETSHFEELERLGVMMVKGDVTRKDSILAGMKGCDWVMHLANLYSMWEPDKELYTEINIKGNQNVMECALETGVAKVVHVSTTGIYGKPEESPFTEETPVGPVRFNEYTRTKYEGDLIAWELHEKKGLPLVVVYPTGVLGPHDPKFTGELIKSLIQKKAPARAFEEAVFTFVHVRDVAEVIVRAAEKENNIGEKYMAGKYQISMKEMYELISEISGVPAPKLRLPDSVVLFNARLLTWLADIIKKPPMWGMSFDGMRFARQGSRSDGSKAERELGITYTPIRVALEEAIASYRVQRL
ncbi:MAG: NAD-dependent epimerase/dehydratase family protein [Desulfobacteraceae bacterium]|jgi:dihydroflavonol-4-reductase